MIFLKDKGYFCSKYERKGYIYLKKGSTGYISSNIPVYYRFCDNIALRCPIKGDINMINEFRGENYFLSNFYESPVSYKGLTYKNNEAAFQAQKCIKDDEKKLFTDLNPSEAKKLGRKIPLRKDWEDIKINVMRDIVRAKFDQNEDLAEKLISTGDEYLEEGNTWGDKIWGTVNGKGANNLGRILMEIREELIRKQERDR